MTQEAVRVLHLEDELVFQMQLDRRLKKENIPHTIFAYDRVEEALKALENDGKGKEEHPYDVIVLDVHLKDTDTQQVIGRKDGYLVAKTALEMGYKPEQIFFASDTPTPVTTFEGIPMRSKEEAWPFIQQAAQALLGTI
jgi:CheY-like chemotaxis protein